MHDKQPHVKHNLKMFFLDGLTFMPSLALISISAIIPFFLEQLGASTLQIAMVVIIPMICMLLTQPLFGFIASRSKVLNRAFGKILILQRTLFLIFVLTIPVFSDHNNMLIIAFIVSWIIFNIFVGSYTIFHTPLVLNLLPPEKRGFIRSIGHALGSLMGVGMSNLIPIILLNILFPYNFMTIFFIGSIFLIANAVVFLLMKQGDNITPTEPMSLKQYTKQMPSTLRESPAFRTMIVTGLLLAIANAMLPYYTLYAIREFSATESHIALLTGLAILATAVGQVSFGFLVDRYGPRFTAALVALFITIAGAVAFTTNTLTFLFVAWIFANLGMSGFFLSFNLLFGVICPPQKLLLYVGVNTMISSAVSTIFILLISPILDNMGFSPLFALIFTCGTLSLLVNIFILKKRIDKTDF